MSTALETLLKRDRLVVMSGLVGIAALAWAYMGYLAADMAAMDAAMALAMPRLQAWGLLELVLLGVMWAVMMVAMMVPTAAPMLLLFATINRRRRAQQRPYVPTAIFLGGYLLVWTAFSAVATLAQWGLHAAALLSPMMASRSPLLGGGLLLAAGIYQWTPLKYTCLRHCRTPLGFLMTDWREGAKGALAMGIKHGLYCTGCCWVLMALLFVAGVMNLLWVAAITAFVLVEKVAPRGDWVGRLAGSSLVAAGLVLLGQALAR
ncbi:MAG: metal-binding protein [Candidatus Tectimicrobiota bacterium]|nr:MAG: metal-binding protein [Candidatus Tectomicrobia bacterium]